MKIIAGSALVLLGVSSFFVLFLTATKTDIVINTSFTVEPGEKY